MATGPVIAPVALHRILFRLRARRRMVSLAHRLALAGLVAMLLATLWFAIPLGYRAVAEEHQP